MSRQELATAGKVQNVQSGSGKRKEEEKDQRVWWGHRERLPGGTGLFLSPGRTESSVKFCTHTSRSWSALVLAICDSGKAKASGVTDCMVNVLPKCFDTE